MDAVAGVAAARGGSLQMPSSQSARKEWRAVSSTSTEELERSKLGQSDERTIYEVQQGTGGLDVDFCSITIDGVPDNDLLQQRLHSVSRQREELQQLEIELRAQVIARVETMDMQKSFDAQIEEHVTAAAKLKEKLQEKEQLIHELERKMDEKERELRAIKIDTEAAWAKEDLLREQNKELATFRRERDNSDAERAQHMKQIHDLSEHIHEKESQYLELEEQHRVAQETLLYKDEQLREAQAWVARAQEMDALQSTTNHSLQAELRERTEQFNQLWLGCQRQFAEMERLHVQAIQQLQLELAEARERSGIHNEDSQSQRADSKDVSLNKGSQLHLNEGENVSANSAGLQNSGVENAHPLLSTVNSSNKTEHVPGVPIVAPPMIGMGAFIPPGQMTALHPYVMHQQSIPHSLPSTNSQVPQSHVGHFSPIPAISSHRHWPNQQAASESSQIPHQNQYQSSPTEHGRSRAEAQYDYHIHSNGQIHADFLDVTISSQQKSSTITSSSEGPQVLESNGKQYLMSEKLLNQRENSSLLHDAQRLDSQDQKDLKVNPEISVMNSFVKSSGLVTASLALKHQNDQNMVDPSKQSQEELNSGIDKPTSNAIGSGDANLHVNSVHIPRSTAGVTMPEGPISAGRASSALLPSKASQPALLDERSLLACIVRAIPAGAGGQIRISTTLPNRLGKMLAPLHWHDYRKQYGKLDEFLARHPELFVIDGDSVHLREGAHEIISATTAAAKVAAAAAAVSMPHTSMLPSVAVTPVAQPHRFKRSPSMSNPSDSSEKSSQNQKSNGLHYDNVQGLSHVKILSKPKDHKEMNGLSSQVRSGRSPVQNERMESASLQNKGSTNGRQTLNFDGKQQGRTLGSVQVARRY